MTSQELNRAIARATGESISDISRRGFVPLSEERLDDDFEVRSREDAFPRDQELARGGHSGARPDH